MRTCACKAAHGGDTQPEHQSGRRAAGGVQIPQVGLLPFRTKVPAGRGHPSVCVGTLRGMGQKPEKGIRLAAPLRAKMNVQRRNK